MSWQAYVDTNLVGTGKVTQAAIIGLAHSDIWARSVDFVLSDKEREAVVAAFKSSSGSFEENLEHVQANGITLSDVKYFTISASISATEGHVYGKKGLNGCVLAKTNQAILVGTYTAPIQQAECTKIVEGLADHLRQHGS